MFPIGSGGAAGSAGFTPRTHIRRFECDFDPFDCDGDGIIDRQEFFEEELFEDEFGFGFFGFGLPFCFADGCLFTNGFWGPWNGFGYGPGYYGYPGYVVPAPPPDNSRVTPDYGNSQFVPGESAGQGSDNTAPQPLTIIFFSDGSNYLVSDYWLDKGQLHYITSYGGENAVDINRVDLQRTVDENAKNGIPFTLRPAAPPAAPDEPAAPDTPPAPDSPPAPPSN